MNRKILFAIVLLCLASFFVFDAFTAGKFFRIRGDFTPDPGWTLGQPGRVLFDIGLSNSGFTAGVDEDGYLTGSFWLGNVGWGTFYHSGNLVPRAKIACSDEVFNNPDIICPLHGFAWSENAGWISLSGSWIENGEGIYASGVYFNPASGRIEGFGHSQALGWIPFYAEASTPITGTSQTGVLFNGVGLNFIGKIAIIGNIAGTRIFNVTNQQVGYIFSSINHADMLNTIRKNIALLSRNGNPVDLANPFSPTFNFMLIRGSDYDTTGGGWVWPAGKRSIIVVGGDVILGESQIGLDTDSNRAIIALKDEVTGSGGNVFINEDVDRIYAFIYAEGSIYSGEKSITGAILPYVSEGVWNIPANQLYIKGAIVSKNTVGGSLQNPPMCPVVISDCNVTNSQIYDINYFRTYDPTDTSQKNVPYDDPRFGVASTVIEFNQSLSSDPPPGISTVFQ